MANPENITLGLSQSADERAIGAGWLLRDGCIVTCDHVVRNVDELWVRHGIGAPKKYRVQAREPQSQTNDPQPAAKGDLALLKPADTKNAWLPMSWYVAEKAQYGQAVDSFGFPTERPNGRSGVGTIGSVVKSRREVIGGETAENGLTQGFSGGPVLSSTGSRVLGVFAATHEESGRGYLIPSSYIAEWLRKQGENEAANAVAVSDAWPTRAIQSIRDSVFGKALPKVDYDLRIVSQISGSGSPAPRQPAYYGNEHVSPKDFVQAARGAGNRSVIFADGGGGKSSFTLKLAEALERSEIQFVWLDLKKLRDELPDSKLSEALALSDPERLLLLARKCTLFPLPTDLQQPAQEIVIIAEGLNEAGAAAGLLLKALDDFVRTTNNVSLVSTVRSTTGLKLPNKTAAYALSRLSQEEIVRISGQPLSKWQSKFLELYGSPLLLNYAVGLGSFDNMHQRTVFSAHVEGEIAAALDTVKQASGFAWVVLESLKRICFDMLASGSLILPDSDWISRLAQAIAAAAGSSAPADSPAFAEALSEQLIGQGLLVKDSQARIGFQHPLITEWLAAAHFVSLGPGGWTSNGFKAISLEDSSEDGLRLALDMVDPAQVELFLLRMYDWRWKTVLALASAGISGLSPSLHDALIGLNALRLCDLFQHTRDQAAPLIRKRSEDGSAFAGKLLEASAISEIALLAVLQERFATADSAYPGGYDLQSWRSLFASEQPPTDKGLDTLISEDAFLGWSASNLLRITQVTAEQFAAMRAAYRGSLTTARSMSPQEVADGFDRVEAGVGLRWRIAHTVGRAVPMQIIDDARAFLTAIWRDESEHRDVRFGACRSLLEIALQHSGLRPGIFEDFEAGLLDWADKAGSADPLTLGGKKWRDDARGAAEQLWRAWPPSEESLSADEHRDWNDRLHVLLGHAKVTADVLGWTKVELEATYEATGKSRND